MIQVKRRIVKSNGVAAIMEAETGYPGYDRRMPFKIVTDIQLSHIPGRLKSANNLLRMSIRNQQKAYGDSSGRILSDWWRRRRDR
jgi:hypothetical protein